MNIVPIKDNFENPRAFLLYLAEREDITGFVIYLKTKEGLHPAQINISTQEMAFAGAHALKWAVDE